MTADGAEAPPSGRPVKRSLTLSGHRTSVTLEAPFWSALRAMAAERGASVNALASRIDAAREADVGLASALRVAILRWAMARRSGVVASDAIATTVAGPGSTRNAEAAGAAPKGRSPGSSPARP